MRKAWIIIPLLAVVMGTLAIPAGQDRFSLRRSLASASEHKAPILDAATTALVNNFDTHVRKSIDREQFPGAAVVIVKDGMVIFSKGYGVKTLNSTDSVNTYTLFRLASLSKGFASVLAGMLVEDGLFEWDDPVVKYCPDFRLRSREYTDALTLRHVLSHTTGLPRQTYSNLIEAGNTYAQARSRLREVRLTHPPGKHYNYQNVAYSLIGEVMEKKTGRRYEDLLYRRIFLPLEMTNAGSGFGNYFIDTSNVAWPHRLLKNAYTRIPVSPKYYEVSPAAGVNACAADMGNWLLFLLGHRPDLMSKDALDTMFSKQIAVPLAETNGRAFPKAEEAWYGLGWRGVLSNERKVIYHGGYVNGFRSEIAFIPSEDVGIAILSNSPSWFINSSMGRFFEMYWGLPNEQQQETVVAE